MTSMNPVIHAYAMRPVKRREAGGLVGAVVLAAMVGTAAGGDMYSLAPYHLAPSNCVPGGVPAQAIITSNLVVQGTNSTIFWYGMQGWYSIESATNLGGPWTSVGRTAASDYAWSLMVTNETPASGYFFRLNQANAYVGSGGCAGCHGDQYDEWSGTAHARAYDAISNLPPAVQQTNLVYRTVGYGQPTGFVSITNTPWLTDVGCENCHGPAAWHKYSDHDLVHPAVSVAAEICGGCHAGPQHPTYSEWTNTLHAVVTPDVASGFLPDPSGQSRQMSCGPCHSGATRTAMLANYEEQQAGIATLTSPLALPSGSDAQKYAVTCAVCHDPHSAETGEQQLRNPQFSTNFYTFFTGAGRTIVTNFNGTTTTFYNNMVFSTQYVASIQICAQCHNSRGAVWTSTSRPPHHSLQYNMLLGSVGELATGDATYQPASHGLQITNQCIGCHMQSSPYVSEQQPAVTGHSFEVASVDICGACHTDPEFLISFATAATSNQIQRVKAALDYWAITKAPASLQAKYGTRAWEYSTPGDLSPGGSGPNSTEQALIPDNIKKARFNLYLVNNDGSYGIHNPLFSVTLLDTAYAWVQQEVGK